MFSYRDRESKVEDTICYGCMYNYTKNYKKISMWRFYIYTLVFWRNGIGIHSYPIQSFSEHIDAIHSVGVDLFTFKITLNINWFSSSDI